MAGILTERGLQPADPAKVARRRPVTQLRPQFPPRLRLGHLEKSHQRMRDQTELPVKIRWPGDGNIGSTPPDPPQRRSQHSAWNGSLEWLGLCENSEPQFRVVEKLISG